MFAAAAAAGAVSCRHSVGTLAASAGAGLFHCFSLVLGIFGGAGSPNALA